MSKNARVTDSLVNSLYSSGSFQIDPFRKLAHLDPLLLISLDLIPCLNKDLACRFLDAFVNQDDNPNDELGEDAEDDEEDEDEEEEEMEEINNNETTPVY